MSNPIDLRQFERVVFFTGAGMSAESGVPTYRGSGGIWSEYRFEDYACQEAFDRNPDRVWDFHDERRQKVGQCNPHLGYELIAQFEKQYPQTTVVTQNIDGLHFRAGSQTVFELHGSLWRVRCDACGFMSENLETPISNRQHSCGAYVRPDIVWFGDSLSADVVSRALSAIRTCDVLVSIGTSAVVMPAAGFPLEAKRAGATTIEVNPEPTALSDVYDMALRLPASDALSQLFPSS